MTDAVLLLRLAKLFASVCQDCRADVVSAFLSGMELGIRQADVSKNALKILVDGGMPAMNAEAEQTMVTILTVE